MRTSTEKIFEKMEQHHSRDEYQEALDLIETLEAREDLTDEERIWCQINRLFISIWSGRERETRLALADELVEKTQALGNPLYVIDVIYLKGIVLAYEDRIQESDELILQAETLVNSLLEQSESSSTQLSHSDLLYRKADILNTKGYATYLKGNVDQAIDILHQSRLLYEESNHYRQYVASMNLGLAYAQKGEPANSLKYYQETHQLCEKLGNKGGQALSLMLLAGFHTRKGELRNALELSEKGLQLAREVNSPNITGVLIFNGGIHRSLGNLDLAKERTEEGLELELANPTFAPLLTDSAKYFLLVIAIEQNDFTLANSYLEQLKQVHDEDPDHRWKSSTYRMAKANILKSSPRLRDRGQAQELFEQIANEPVINISMTAEAILHLSSLLLYELRITGDPAVLKELQSLIKRLHEITESSSSYWMAAQTLVLKARLALVELDFKVVRNHLTQAQLIAEKYQMGYLTKEIAKEYDLLMERLERWEEFVVQKTSVGERADILQVEALVTRMLYTQGTNLEDPLIRAHIIAPESFVVNEEIRLAIDLINIGRKPGLVLRIEKLLPKRFTLLETQPEYVTEGGSLILDGKLLGPMQTISLSLNVRIEGYDSIELFPQVVYANLQGGFEISHPKSIRITPLLTFESTKAQVMFEHLVDAFRKDNLGKKLHVKDSGWRTRTQVLKSEPQLHKRDLYGSQGQFGRLLKELHDYGMVEVKSEAGKRSRGGQRLKIRVAYDREAVKQYVSKK